MSKKKKPKVIPFQPISIERYVKERARSLPFGKCFEVSGPFASMGHVVVSRVRKNGTHIFAFYLVDKGCLGLKDTFIQEYDDLEDFLDYMSKFGEFEELGKEIDPVYAQNLIYGAIEWAEDAGIKPHKYFETTQYMLEDVEELEYMEIEFGLEGKHCYYQDDENNDSKKIIKTLEKNLGEGNFMVVPSSLYGDEEDSDLLGSTFYDRYIYEIEAFEDELEIEDNLVFKLQQVENQHGDLTFGVLSLYCLVATDFEIQLTEKPYLEDQFETKPDETVGKMKKSFLRRNKKHLGSKGFTTEMLEALPHEAIIYNTILFDSYTWLLLPEVIKAIAFNFKDQEEFKEENYFRYIEFLAPVKERIAFHLNMCAMCFSNSKEKPNQNEMENIWDTLILKVFEEYPDFIMDDYDNLPLQQPLSELEEIDSFYKIPEGEEMLRWMKENGHHPYLNYTEPESQ